MVWNNKIRILSDCNGCVKVHLKEEKFNNQGSLMKIFEYTDNRNIVVEFQDDYKFRTHMKYMLLMSVVILEVQQSPRLHMQSLKDCQLDITRAYKIKFIANNRRPKDS